MIKINSLKSSFIGILAIVGSVNILSLDALASERVRNVIFQTRTGYLLSELL